MDRKCSGTDWLGGLRRRKKYGPVFFRKPVPAGYSELNIADFTSPVY